MTNEELDRARAEQAWSEHYKNDPASPTVIAARLAREGWTPPEPVDPDMVEAELIAREVYASDKPSFCDAARRGIKRGRELERADLKVLGMAAHTDVNGNTITKALTMSKSGGFSWTTTLFTEVTPPAEDVA